jgi:hypothetical protein
MALEGRDGGGRSYRGGNGLQSTALIVAACLTLNSAVAETRSPISATRTVAQVGGKWTTAMKIRMTVNGKVATATLDDTPAARDFASLLPLSLTLTDYASTEKVSGLPRRLSQEDAPAGHDPSAGDITYYAPWGNLAIFYRDFGYSPGLIRLGTIDSGIEALHQSGSLQTTIEVVAPRRGR